MKICPMLTLIEETPPFAFFAAAGSTSGAVSRVSSGIVGFAEVFFAATFLGAVFVVDAALLVVCFAVTFFAAVFFAAVFFAAVFFDAAFVVAGAFFVLFLVAMEGKRSPSRG